MRVLVIDDEYLIRRHICNSIDWTSMQMCVVGEARNGTEGLEVVERIQPDIVLVDINMPGMDGLDFAKIMKCTYPDICLIIITGYKEFEYAKRALNEGVFYFLSKPIEKEKCEEVLKAAKSELERRRREHELAHAMIILQKEEWKKKQSKRIFTENCTEDEIQHFINQICPEFKEQNILVAIVKWEFLDQARYDEETIGVIWKLIEEAIAIQVAVGMSYCVLKDVENNLVLILSCVGDAEEILKRLKKMGSLLETLVQMEVNAAISEIMQGYASIPSLYQQAIHALREKFALEDCKVIAYHREKNQKYMLGRYFDAEQLLLALRLNKAKEIEECIGKVYEQLRKNYATRESSIFASLFLLSTLSEFLEEKNCAFEYTANELAEKVSELESYDNMREFVLSLFRQSLEMVFQQYNVLRNEKVEQAECFIREHYMEKSLSLKMVSSELFINASYLSTIFKKELGITLSEYITGIRLKKACELLNSEKNLTVHDIAWRVGFNDEYYFMRCFKKKYGISPKVYQENRKINRKV